MPYLCGFWRFANAYFFDNMKGEINAKKTTFCISTNYFMLFIRM